MSKLNLKDFFTYTFDIVYDKCTTKCEHGVCDCGVLDNFYFTGIKKNALTKAVTNYFWEYNLRSDKIGKIIFGKYRINKTINRYTTDRILNHYNFWDYSNYVVDTERGHYNPVIKGIYFKDDLFSHMSRTFSDFKKILNTKSRLENLLLLEYDRQHPQLTDDVQYKIITITRNDLSKSLLNEKHIANLNKVTVNTSIPIGIVIREHDGYNIIDGYHRIFSIDNPDKPFRVYLAG